MNDSGPVFDLGDAADRFRISEGDVDAVIAVARRRTRRKRRTVSILTAVALVASVPVAQRLLAPSDEGTPVAATAPVQRGSLGITWRRAEPKASLGFARGMTTQGPLYAVSSAPGERAAANRQASRVVWRSDDGVEWNAASTLGPDLYLANLSARDDRVYAVGTVPAEAVGANRVPTLRSSDLVVGWSDDGARRWEKKELPLDLDLNVATRFGTVAVADVASGPRGTVAVAVLNAELDVPVLLPQGVTAPHGWATTATGVDVLGPEQGNSCPTGFRGNEKAPPEVQPPGEVPPTWCQKGEETVTLVPQQVRKVEGSYSWEQLGVRGDVLGAVRRRPVAFFARPGSTEFQRVALPEISDVMALTVEANDDGFDLVATVRERSGIGDGALVVLRSDDGRSWSKAAAPGNPTWAVGLGTLDGRTAFVTADEKGGAFSMADGNGGWKSVSLADIVDPEVLDGRVVNLNTAAFGPFGVAVSAVLVPNRKEFDEDAVSHRLLVSRDGATWDDIAVGELIGAKGAFVSRVTITGNDIVVTAALSTRDKRTGPQQQVVMVGTPA